MGTIMTLDHDSAFDLGKYVQLVESLWDGKLSEQSFVQEASALGADPETIETVIANMKQMDGIND